jgi:hypothetical protein
MMHGGHVRGQRAGAFIKLVGGIDPQRVVLVGVDVAKATWFVVASTLVGEVVVDGVGLVADRGGLTQLERLIATMRAELAAQLVMTGLEAAGHHHQRLISHLGDPGGTDRVAAQPWAGGCGAQAAGQPSGQDRLAGRGRGL